MRLELEELYQEDSDKAKAEEQVYFSLVSPPVPNGDPKHKPHIPMKNHHDRLCVIDLVEAQNSLEFYQTAKGSVLCYNTIPPEFPAKIISPRNKSVRFLRKTSSKMKTKFRLRHHESKREPEKQAATHVHVEDTLKFPTKEEVSKENISSEVCSQCEYSTKNTRMGTIFCKCGKKFGGRTTLSEQNAQVVYQQGGEVIQ